MVIPGLDRVYSIIRCNRNPEDRTVTARPSPKTWVWMACWTLPIGIVVRNPDGWGWMILIGKRIISVGSQQCKNSSTLCQHFVLCARLKDVSISEQNTYLQPSLSQLTQPRHYGWVENTFHSTMYLFRLNGVGEFKDGKVSWCVVDGYGLWHGEQLLYGRIFRFLAISELREERWSHALGAPPP